MAGPTVTGTGASNDETITSPDQARTRADRDRPVLAVGATLGRFVVLERLGRGGMGEVYSAYDGQLDRRVAVKVMRRGVGSGADAGREQMLKEARALAALSHPNVVAVHEAGEFGDQVFIAMEYIDGESLSTWLKEPRGWREVLDVFLAAGRGLAGAHAAGVVHRDFKPHNVLLGKDGRARVVDFGIARRVALREDSGELKQVPGAKLATSLAGTPQYMAPEQAMARDVDARSDQFSFCVALYEGLYGALPFGAFTLEGGDAPKEPAPAPRLSQVPSEVFAALRRGMAWNPDDRFASMDALLEALARSVGPRRRRALWAVVGAASLVALGGAVFAWRAHAVASCRLEAQGLAASGWNAQLRAAIGDDFAKTAVPYAADAWKQIEPELNAWFSGWVESRAQACEATRLRGVQTEEAYGLRARCFDEELGAARALTGLLAQADAATAANATKAVRSLPDVVECGDVERLAAMPKEPVDAERRAELERIKSEFNAGKALVDTGQFARARDTLSPLVPAIKKVGYRPVEVAVQYQLGIALATLQPADAELALREAMFAAEAMRDDSSFVRAASVLAQVQGSVLARADDARLSLRHADAVLEHLPARDDLRGQVEYAHGVVELRQGNFEQARTQFQAALEHTGRALGVDHPMSIRSLSSLAVAEKSLGRYDDALALQHRVQDLMEQRYGPHHTEYGQNQLNIGVLMHKLGRYGEAVEYYQRALGIFEAVNGPDSAYVASAASNMGDSFAALGKYDEALASYERARAILAKQRGGQSPDVGAVEENECELFLARGAPTEAQPHCEQARALLEKSSPKHPAVAMALNGLAECALARKNPREAAALATQARELLAKAPGYAGPAGQSAFILARAALDGDRDAIRARALAQEARADFDKAGRQADGERKKLDAWMTDRLPSVPNR